MKERRGEKGMKDGGGGGEDLRDGGEKKGRCGTKEIEEGEMRDEEERRGGDAGQRRGKRGRISDEGEERQGGDGTERRQRLVTIYLCVAANLSP